MALKPPLLGSKQTHPLLAHAHALHLHFSQPTTQHSRCISSIQRHLRRPPRGPSPYNHPSRTGLPAMLTGPAGSIRRRILSDTLPLRTGVLATKKGMTAVVDATTGRRTACTVLQVDRAQVVAVKTAARHGYDAVVVGSGWRAAKNVPRALLGVFAGARNVGLAEGAAPQPGVSPKKDVREFKVRDARGLLPVGTMVTAGWFQEGQFVDAQARTRGMGFAGGMKRHGFAGQPASHGASLTHRAIGSAGPSQGGGSRVYPGKKMPGRMGGQLHTVQNLRVLKVDDENGLVVVNGCLSGPKGCLVKIQDAKKKPWPHVPEVLPSREAAAEALMEVETPPMEAA